MRIGHGYDVHKLVHDRKLILGGVGVEFELGLYGHSDADVLTHAVIDALLGAAALGDIGAMFPDSDMAYSGISSLLLLERTAVKVFGLGYTISNLDCTIIAQRPKLVPYIPRMKDNIAKVLNLSAYRLNIKATTEEHLGFTGAGLGIAAHAVVLLNEKGKNRLPG